MRRQLSRPNIAATFEELRNDLNAARSNRFRRRRTGLNPMGSGADYHYRSEGDYLRVMEYARDMDRNDAVIGQMIDRAVTNLVQDGISLDPQTGDEGLNKDIRARWTDWAEDPEQCDLAGERTFWELEQLVPRQALVDGDIMALPNRDGAIELVEAHRCRTPRNTTRNVVHGVLLDPATRRRLQYWFTKEDVDPNSIVTKVADITAVDARDEEGFKQVFHVMLGKRASQTRGITALAPVFDTAGDFEDLAFAKLVQAKVVSCIAFFRKLQLGSDMPGTPEQAATLIQQMRDGQQRQLDNMSPGMMINGVPGEEITGFSPQVPNPEFFPHVKLILTLIGINLGMPLVLVLLDASETNFSGWKGALDSCRLGFRQNQRRLINRFHRPVYLWKVRQWLSDDAALRRASARSDVNVFAHRFIPPVWPYNIQPLQQASADLLKTRNALISHSRRCAEEGRDWDDVSDEIANDNAKLIVKAHKKALELKKEYPDLDVTWREIASLPTPDGVQISIQSDREEEPRNAAA